jgi:NADH-quinone oxidoreductase subunit I
MIARIKRGFPWLGNVLDAIYTVVSGMWVTLRTWFKTYQPDRKTFTEHFEYPELPVPVAARYRGFHRFDLTTCISCDLCAKACPVDCIYIGKEKSAGSKGFKVTGFTIDYGKCMFCALCTEPCPTECIHMGKNHDMSAYSRLDMVVEFAELDKKGLRTPISLSIQRNAPKIPWAAKEKARIERGELATTEADIPSV